jgi:hypothetical protein
MCVYPSRIFIITEKPLRIPLVVSDHADAFSLPWLLRHEKVIYDVPSALCRAGLCRLAVPVTGVTAPSTSGATAPARRLPADCAPPTAPAHRSPLLGLPVSSVDRLVGCPGLCAAAHHYCLAAETVPRPLEAAESAWHLRPPTHCQEGPGADASPVAGTPDRGSPRVVGELRKRGTSTANRGSRTTAPEGA